MRKRGSEVTRIDQYANKIKVKHFDTDLWCARAIKSVDSEREKKRHKDNG